MSQSTEIEYLDGEFTVNETEPSTLEELTLLLGTEEAVVDEVTSNLRYRNKYPRVYKLASAAVAALGFARAVIDTKTLKDNTIREVKESENDHLRAFLKGRFDKEGNVVSPAPEGSREKLQSLFDEIANAQPLYAKGERTAGGGKVSQAATDLANKFFAAGVDKVEEVGAKIESLVPGYKIGRDADGAITVEALARGVQTLNKHEERKAKLAAAAALA